MKEAIVLEKTGEGYIEKTKFNFIQRFVFRLLFGKRIMSLAKRIRFFFYLKGIKDEISNNAL